MRGLFYAELTASGRGNCKKRASQDSSGRATARTKKIKAIISVVRKGLMAELEPAKGRGLEAPMSRNFDSLNVVWMEMRGSR